MRKPKKTYLYRYNEYIGEFPSLLKAAQYANEDTQRASNVIRGLVRQTRNGYFYSYSQLTSEQISNLPREKEENHTQPTIKQRTYNTTHRILDNDIEIEADPRNLNIFQFPRTRKEKVNLLKKFIYKKLIPIWQTQNKRQSTLEKEFIKDLLGAIE